MKAGPDIARVASLIGDPARANMLTALTGGETLSAGELAREAGVTAQTASSHLAKLQAGGLVVVQRQGRHSYFKLSGDDVAALLESLMGVALGAGHARTRPGPREPALRLARACYDHLAGELGVAMLDGLRAQGVIEPSGAGLRLTASGVEFAAGFGLDLAALERARRPLCRPCLDWSERRSHLAGGLGAAFYSRLLHLGWAKRERDGRAVIFSREGRRSFDAAFGIQACLAARERPASRP
jgi:DNA-binding transcriptional ArsR family regulator